jgi:hypothetical protein
LEAAVSDYVGRKIQSQAERKAPQIFFEVAKAAPTFTHFQVGPPGFHVTDKKNGFCVALM